MRTALYLRVSTDDKGQDVSNQRLQLEDACKAWGYEIVEVYEDNESGGKGRKGRAGFDQMFKDAEKGKFDIVCFWALDRFSRQGIQMTLDYLRLLSLHGVGFRSLTEPLLNTDNELIRHMLIGLISYLAELERKRQSERVIAGMDRARRQGKTFGRPTKAGLGSKISTLRATGHSWRQVAEELDISVNTARKYAKA